MPGRVFGFEYEAITFGRERGHLTQGVSVDFPHLSRLDRGSERLNISSGITELGLGPRTVTLRPHGNRSLHVHAERKLKPYDEPGLAAFVLAPHQTDSVGNLVYVVPEWEKPGKGVENPTGTVDFLADFPNHTTPLERILVSIPNKPWPWQDLNGQAMRNIVESSLKASQGLGFPDSRGAWMRLARHHEVPSHIRDLVEEHLRQELEQRKAQAASVMHA